MPSNPLAPSRFAGRCLALGPFDSPWGEVETGAHLLFGRDRELPCVGSFLESLPTAGPAALVIDGEPGIGKTTLWRAALDAAGERGYRLLSSRPAEADASPSFAGHLAPRRQLPIPLLWGLLVDQLWVR
jgi:hypothetical protein